MDPSHEQWSLGEIRWSEFLESVRKDVECVFGIIKSRFRKLHNPIQLHSEAAIERCYKTACVQHNMILSYNQGVQSELHLWENATWERVQVDEDSFTEEVCVNVLEECEREITRRQSEVEAFLPKCTNKNSQKTHIHTNSSYDYLKLLKNILMESFHFISIYSKKDTLA